VPSNVFDQKNWLARRWKSFKAEVKFHVTEVNRPMNPHPA
jgi:hypothetical protein